MQLPTLLATAGFAASVTVAAPLDARQEDHGSYPSNCTTYSSVSSGTHCLDRPYDCTATYLVQPDDNCHGIVNSFGNFTPEILYYWNPDIGRSCDLTAYIPLCINTPWYSFSYPVEQPYGTVETVADLPATQQPVPLAGRTLENCTRYERAGGGYYEYTMKQQNGFTDEEFESWNPSVGDSLSTEADYWYAVDC